MDYTLHGRISEFVKSTALTPPRHPGEDGFDLLDVVVVNPMATDPAKMLIPTNTNLNKHYTHKKVYGHNRSADVHASNQVRRSEESFALTEELQTALGVKGVARASGHGSHKSSTKYNLVISSEKTFSISGATFHLIEDTVKSKFTSIVENAAKYVITRKTRKDHSCWRNYFSRDQEDYHYVAVITKVYYGKFSVEECDNKGYAAGASVKLTAPIASFSEAMFDNSWSGSVNHISDSEGAVGVQMLCFPFRRAENDGDYYVCDPIAIKWLDKKERLKLTKSSKECHWKLIKNTGASEIFYERGRRSQCRSFIKKSVKQASAYDFTPFHSLLTVLLAFALLYCTVSNGAASSNSAHMCRDLLVNALQNLKHSTESLSCFV